MASIDDRIVNMQFNNRQFQQHIFETNESLEKLNQNLNLKNATVGIDNAQRAVNQFSMANMENALTSIDNKFSAFGAIAFTVINNLTNKVIDAGIAMGAALIDPIINGGERRALALQKAQFQFRGLGLDIEATMTIARNAVLGTAFSLDQAATAAGQLGASGITAGHGLAEALRGIAGVAAQSGASFDQVAQIFEKVAGNGRLMGVELLQMSSYGINAAATLAKAMGTTEANIREMVSEGKISFQQFSDAMGAAFGDNAKKANELFTGALANMNAALARLGAEFEGPKLFNLRDIFNAMSPLIDKVHESLMPLINAFNVLQNSGAANTVKAISELLGPGLVRSIDNAVAAIIVIYAQIKNAFKQIFPSDFETQMARISNFLQRITRDIIPTARSADQLRRTFAGVFAIFSILGQIVSSVIQVFFDLFNVVAPAGASFLGVTANIGDFLVKIDELLKKGDFIYNFFKGLGEFVAVPLALFQTFFGIIADGIQTITRFGLSGEALDAFSADVEKRFGALVDIGNFFIMVFKAVAGIANKVYEFLLPVFATIGRVAEKVIDGIRDALKGLTFQDGLALINTGLFAGLLLLVQGFFGSFEAILAGASFGFISQINVVLTTLRINLKALEVATNAQTLKQIAIAIALLAASAVVLSLVDPIKLGAALVVMASFMGGLITTFTALSTLQPTTKVLQMLALAAAMQVIAGAVLTLAVAVAILGAIPAASMFRGLLGLVVVIGALTGAMLLLSRVGPQVLLAAAAIAIIAPPLVLLTAAIAILGAIPLPNLIQGMAGLVVLLAALAGALALLALVGPKVLLGAISIALIAPAIVLLTGAVAAMAALPLPNLIQGVAAFVVVLAALVGGMLLLGLAGPMVLIGAVAIAAVALSMIPLIGAIALLSALPLPNLIQGMVAFTVALAILVGAVLLLGVTGPIAALGAAALLAMAFAIAVLAPALVLLSAISWDGIGRLFTILSAGLAILAVMGILLIPASVGFILFGNALILIGVGVTLIGTGLGVLAAGIGLLVAGGAAGLGVLAAGIGVFIAALPRLGIALGQALVGLIVAVGEAAPKLITAFIQLLSAMLAAITQVVPEIIQTAVTLITALIEALMVLIPLLVRAGLEILKGILQGIADNIEDIVKAGADIIIHWLEGLTSKLPDIIKAAGDTVLAFINGMATYIDNNSQKFVDAGSKLFRAIIDGVSRAIIQGGAELRYAGSRIGTAILIGAMKALGIASPSKKFQYEVMPRVFDGIEAGNDSNISRAANAGAAIGDAIGNTALTTMQNSLSQLSNVLDLTDIDTSPTIRPLLDLTDVQNKATEVSRLLQTPTLSLDTTNGVAQSVSLQEQTRNAQIVLDATKATDTSKGDVFFTQNNTSPKALSTVELYRQTKNQLSTLKGELGVVDQSGSS